MGNQLREQALLHWVVRLEFGVPLNGEAPGVRIMLDCLDDAVFCPGDRPQAAADFSNGLVVPGLDDDIHDTEGGGEPARALDGRVVLGWKPLGATVGDRVLERVRDMNVEITPAGHVEDLHAATDAQDGSILALEDGANQLEFEGVALAADGVQRLVRLASIGFRVEVAAAREDEAVDEIEIMSGIWVARGQDYRDSAGAPHAIDVTTWDSKPRGRAVARIRGDSNDGATRCGHGRVSYTITVAQIDHRFHVAEVK